MAAHSSTLAWKIPWTEESGRMQSMRLLRVGQAWATSLSLPCIGEGNGNPLQCSCLENPRDRGACWAAVYGVAQSWTRLNQLSSSSSSREGNGKRLQYSCLENPRDGAACWAATYGVAQSRTRLKWLSSSSSSKTWLWLYSPGCPTWPQRKKTSYVPFLCKRWGKRCCSCSVRAHMCCALGPLVVDLK